MLFIEALREIKDVASSAWNRTSERQRKRERGRDSKCMWVMQLVPYFSHILFRASLFFCVFLSTVSKLIYPALQSQFSAQLNDSSRWDAEKLPHTHTERKWKMLRVQNVTRKNKKKKNCQKIREVFLENWQYSLIRSEQRDKQPPTYFFIQSYTSI